MSRTPGEPGARPHVELLTRDGCSLCQRVYGRLGELAAELAPTVVIITHDRETVEALADRVAVLAHGRIAAIGPVAEVAALDDPAVAAFFAASPQQVGSGDTAAARAAD